MIPEKEREALMRLTMCAREECIMCKYHKECDFDFQYHLATESMNILAEALRKTEPTCSILEQVEDETRLTAKCLNCANGGSYKCSKCDGEMYYKYDKDEPQTDIHGLTDCDFCKGKNCEDCEGGKDEPQTEDYCDICNHKGCEYCISDSRNPYCIPSNYEPRTEGNE